MASPAGAVPAPQFATPQATHAFVSPLHGCRREGPEGDVVAGLTERAPFTTVRGIRSDRRRLPGRLPQGSTAALAV